jgi:hypothetical protein
MWGEMLPSNRAVISGVITDEKGNPKSYANVVVEQEGQEIAETWTDASGNYRISVHPVKGSYDLSATHGTLGYRSSGLRLRQGERTTLNLQLKESLSISGTLMMLDNQTPHAGVMVQAVRAVSDDKGEPIVVATVISDDNGKYQFVNLKPGQYQIRCYTTDGYIYYNRQYLDGMTWTKTRDNRLFQISSSGKVQLQVEPEQMFSGVDFHFARFKNGTWKHYTLLDGLAGDTVLAIEREPSGAMWFGTQNGVSRYDGKTFVNFTTEDGLAGNNVRAIHCDADRVIWFGTYGGVSRYDGTRFVNFTTAEGLAHNRVLAIQSEPDGVIWFGTGHSLKGGGGGVSRYDGENWVTFTNKDG